MARNLPNTPSPTRPLCWSPCSGAKRGETSGGTRPAAACVAELRPAVDVVVGLTHIGHRQDIALAETVPGIDILLTGHSHTVLDAPLRVGRTWICQGGSHGRFAGLYRWTDGEMTGGLQRLS